MIVFRPVQSNDINQLEVLAKASGSLVSTLQEDRTYLTSKIERSNSSFMQDVISAGDQSYLFVLEDINTKQLLGAAGINARAGHKAPFYSFRHDIKIHSSNELNVHNRVHALTLNHDLSDHSQLCSFYITPKLLESDYPLLMTMSRLLYMRLSPERFSEKWMAVLPGVFDQQGLSPFWENVGRKFLGIGYDQVNHYHCTYEKTFIAEMMPYHPLYIALMDEQAQNAIGLINKEAQLQSALLNEQGFETSKYVDIFDAGAVLTRSNKTNALSENIVPVTLLPNQSNQVTQPFLVAIQGTTDFISCLVDGVLNNKQLMINQETLNQLNVPTDSNIFAIALNQHNHIDDINIKESN